MQLRAQFLAKIPDLAPEANNPCSPLGRFGAGREHSGKLAPRKGMNTIAFIGVGIMGKPMARNLLKAGHKLIVHDKRPEPVADLAAEGAATAGSSAEAARQAEIAITMLPNSPDVKEAVLGPRGILEGARPGLILVDMSSIAPLAAKQVEAKCREKGVSMLDAPVSGGEPKAKDGTLSIMVGGDKAVFDRVSGILGAMGKSVVWVGGIGSGNMTKLANQIIVGLNIIAMSEALVLAAKAGVDPKVVYQAIRGGLAGSTVLDAKAPLVVERRFNPGFRIELHRKDLMNAMDTAHEVGAPLPFTALATEVMSAMKAAGQGGLDHGGLVQYFERLAGIEVR
jgi:2-hydroxy-3-oxopropionate reductase